MLVCTLAQVNGAPAAGKRDVCDCVTDLEKENPNDWSTASGLLLCPE
jgi:hypothetical protein